MKYKILIIIVTYNGEKWVSDVVNGINKSTLKLDTIIVDNGSTDKTLQLYEKKLKNIVKIVKNRKNLGFGAANNIGLEYAIKNNYDYVYLLNQDARFFEDTVEKLINISLKNSNIGILSPFQCGKGLEKIDKNFQVNTCAYESNDNIFSDLYFGNLKEVYEVDRVMAAHRLLPIETIKKVGGFSPTFFHYGEDDNYIDRAKYFGLRICIAPNINVVHDRYNRIESKDKKYWMGYTYGLNLLSNPIKKKNVILTLFAINFYHVLLYKSLKPIKNILKIFVNYSKIKRNRKESMLGNSPFLKHNN